jgi:SAM-dependent methyltransferase
VDRATISAVTHAGVPYANPLSPAALDAAVEALELPDGAVALDVGCGDGRLLERIAARHGGRVSTVGVEPSPAFAAAARTRVDVVHELPLVDAPLAPASFDLVACVASSHAFGAWADGLTGMAGLTRPGGFGLAAEGFWRRPPSAAYLELLGGATADELPDLDGLLAGARAAGWTVDDVQVASDDDWAAYEEALIRNGERRLDEDPDPDLRAWVDAARARWEHPDGRDTLGFALLRLRRVG